MHQDNVSWDDQMASWKDDPKNKKYSKAGDDRSPAHRWLGSLYHDDTHIGLPADNVMKAFMQGGAQVPVPGGRNGKTFKAQSQSGLMIDQSHWPLLVGGKPIDVKPILALENEPVFAAHQTAVERAGFKLDLRRVGVGGKKHVRVRPRFDTWTVTGTITVWDEQITQAILQEIARYAGTYKGIGDWRPGGKTPGGFGLFTATVK